MFELFDKQVRLRDRRGQRPPLERRHPRPAPAGRGRARRGHVATHHLPLTDAPEAYRKIPRQGGRHGQGGVHAVRMPKPRGPLSESVVARLADGAAYDAHAPSPVADTPDDEAIALLWTLHELSYRGFEDAWPNAGAAPRDPRRAPRPRVVARAAPARPGGTTPTSRRCPLLPTSRPPSRSWWPRTTDPPWPTTYAASPTSTRPWAAAPALDLPPQGGRPDGVGGSRDSGGTAKAALMEIQFDEYGAGGPDRLHPDLFELRDGRPSASTRSTATTSTRPRPRSWSRTTR